MKPLHYGVWLSYILTTAIIFLSGSTKFENAIQTAIGGITLVSGSWLMLWAKNYLGQMYHRLPNIKEGHALIMNGPYALTRHPEYVGLIIGFLGLSLLLNSLAGVIATLAILTPIHAILAKQEEELLEKHFKDKYKQYKEKVGLTPKK